METNTAQNRKMLKKICTLGRVAGWAIIAMGILRVGGIAHLSWGLPGFGMQNILASSLFIVKPMLSGVVGPILIGLAVLGTVQFIRYAVEEGDKPRWLLRNGHIILCLYASYLLLTGSLLHWPLLWTTWEDFLNRSPEQMIPMGRALGIASTTLIIMLPPITKVLCVLGIAAALRTVLPILAESKTLA